MEKNAILEVEDGTLSCSGRMSGGKVGYYPESEHFSLLEVWKGVPAWRVSGKPKGPVCLLPTLWS